ncbi:hypothetical protein RGQ29_019056 [Quercus rubra]|uniref:FBD domain-containing protein n=1 Tax=Quercus rubra TaxID=3512 RepID=A0AAN7F895_QUERU|nr:hypothetical protein RGQ29_019056 [Quercus rubra]
MEESSSSNSSVHAQIIGSKPKRPKSFHKTKHTVDHISPLHDSILHYILSFLAAEDAIKTSVLSKRWNRLWTFASDLSFYNHRGVARVPDFVAFVCKALELYSSSGKLDKFIIDFEYKTSYASEVNKWVCFATTHKVVKLYLEFETSGSSYLFCHFTKKPTICWASLKVLWIGYARLSHDMMQNILLGSPALTELRLYNFVFKGYNVVITSTSLKKLELQKRKTLVLDTQLDRWDLPGIANLLQSSPYLEKLIINLVPSYNSKFEFPPDYTDSNFDHEENWQSKDMTFGPLHLKTVEIIGFEARCVGLKFVTRFVQFLLKQARVLEKMIIYGKRDDLNNQILTIVTQLFLSYQRSSPNAVVLFS